MKINVQWDPETGEYFFCTPRQNLSLYSRKPKMFVSISKEDYEEIKKTQGKGDRMFKIMYDLAKRCLQEYFLDQIERTPRWRTG